MTNRKGTFAGLAATITLSLIASAAFVQTTTAPGSTPAGANSRTTASSRATPAIGTTGKTATTAKTGTPRRKTSPSASSITPLPTRLALQTAPRPGTGARTSAPGTPPVRSTQTLSPSAVGRGATTRTTTRTAPIHSTSPLRPGATPGNQGSPPRPATGPATTPPAGTNNTPAPVQRP